MRHLENAGLTAAIILTAIYCLAEASARVGFCKAVCPTEVSFPWGMAIMVVALVLPKTVGRATAGRVWDAIADRLGGKDPRP